MMTTYNWWTKWHKACNTKLSVFNAILCKKTKF